MRLADFIVKKRSLCKKMTNIYNKSKPSAIIIYTGDQPPKVASLPYVPRNAVIIDTYAPLFLQFGKNAIALTNGVYWLADDMEPTKGYCFAWDRNDDGWVVNLLGGTVRSISGLYIFKQGKTFIENSLVHISKYPADDFHLETRGRRRILKSELQPEMFDVVEFTLEGKTMYTPMITFEKVFGDDL